MSAADAAAAKPPGWTGGLLTVAAGAGERGAADSTGATALRAEWAAATDVGQRRSHNEDAWAVVDLTTAGTPPATLAVPDGGLLLVVCDGIGGSQAGEVASEFCVRQLPIELQARSGTPATQALAEAIVATHQALAAKARTQADWRGMGSTLSALWLTPVEGAIVGHVGDSRIYTLRGTDVVTLTDDHTVGAGMVRRGELTPEAAAKLRYRAMLEQSMGGDGDPIAPHVHACAATPGATFLLCSDGLHGVVPPERLAAALATPAGKLADEVAALAAAANAAGGPDNITALLLRLSAGT